LARAMENFTPAAEWDTKVYTLRYEHTSDGSDGGLDCLIINQAKNANANPHMRLLYEEYEILGLNAMVQEYHRQLDKKTLLAQTYLKLLRIAQTDIEAVTKCIIDTKVHETLTPYQVLRRQLFKQELAAIFEHQCPKCSKPHQIK
jgi:hypothetical protein